MPLLAGEPLRRQKEFYEKETDVGNPEAGYAERSQDKMDEA